MLDPQKLAPWKEQKREELFIERYERLLAWALQLTNKDKATAEDLVQDAFIQFVLGRTSLETIENIDGYLRRMLRYMHLSRMSRNAQKVLERTIPITDYDSFHQSWGAIEPARRMQAREELWQICAYACSRKETSRAGAVLILRFFHDYYPTEIAQVLCGSRHCVDQWQRVARSELKLYLTERGGLRLMNTKLSLERGQTKLSGWDGDLIAELRQIIFTSRKGECLPIAKLREVYQSSNTETLTSARLGHIVSCRLCLDAVNQILGLPLLAERCQSEQGQSEGPPRDKNGGGSSGGGSIDLRAKYKRRLREVSEHKPKELRIAVNGSLVSSLKVSSEESELDLNLPQEESVEFVEVFSEQGVQLLFFSVGETNSPETPQWATIELSEGRKLKACLRLKNGPTLQVIYSEPLLEDAVAQTPLKLVKDAVLPAPTVASTGGLDDQYSSSWPIRFFRHFRLRVPAVFNAIKPSGKTIEPSPSLIPDTTAENYLASSQVSLLGLASPGIRKPLWTRPGWLTALISTVVVIGGFVFLRTGTTPTLTAANLLERASVGEKIAGNSPDQITHRIINLEERRSVEGAALLRRKIEIWQNSASGDRAQRLYDGNNKLIAGAWQKADGARTVYHHGGRSREAAPAGTDGLLLNLDEIWQLELSAKKFSELIVRAADAQMEERADSYFITYGNGRTIGASRLLKATLKLNRADLHPIEQTLLVERGGEVREYRFVEASFERLPQKDVEPSVFEPELELLSERRKDEGGRMKPAVEPLHPSSFIPHPSPVASAELEVDVAYLLNQAKGDRGEQLSLSRTASGLLRVEGVVDTEQRKDELVRALAPVSNNPAVKIEIGTIAEAMRRQVGGPSGAVTIRDAEETANTVAVDNELRYYLARRDVALQNGSNLDEAVRSFSSRTVNRAYRALFHAIELKRLVNRFANVDMRTVTPDARAKWLHMVREHAAALERENAALRQDIQPLFFSGSPSAAAEEIEIAGDVDLARAVERLHKLALANNDSIRAAFTISTQSSSAVKSLQFWRSLSSTEKLATRIKKYPG